MLKMEQIAFEITRKFNAYFTYRHVGNGNEWYSFSKAPREEVFSFDITSDCIKFEVDLFRFDDFSETHEVEISEKKKVQNFLHRVLYFLTTSDTWEEFVKQLYFFSEFSFK